MFLLACNNDDQPGFDYEELPNQIYSIDKSTLTEITRIPELKSYFEYDVVVYKIDYNTIYKGELITVSGAIAIPKEAQSPAIITYSHGTLDNSGDAPTEATNRPLTFTQFAAAGYIVFAPDFIGIGTDVARQDPWLIAEPLAQAVVDMIIAGKEFLTLHEVPFASKVFLAGYSQGGNSTLAALRMIQDLDLDLDITASAPGGGVYDMDLTFDRRMNGNGFSQTIGVVYLLNAFISYYDWEADFSNYLQEPYASEFNLIYAQDGFFADKVLNSTLLTEKISNGQFNQDNVLLESFIEDFNSNSTNEFRQKLAENSLLEWTPKSPLTLFYGEADSTSYFENSIRAYESFLASGANPGFVKLSGFEGKDHFAADGPWAESTLQYFNSFLSE